MTLQWGLFRDLEPTSERGQEVALLLRGRALGCLHVDEPEQKCPQPLQHLCLLGGHSSAYGWVEQKLACNATGAVGWPARAHTASPAMRRAPHATRALALEIGTCVRLRGGLLLQGR